MMIGSPPPLIWDTGTEPSNWNEAELIAEAEPLGSPDCDKTSGRGSTCSAVGPCTCTPVSCGHDRDNTYLVIITKTSLR